MKKYTYRVLAASVILALSMGVGVEAKGSATKIMTDPVITQKAIAAQMDQKTADKTVNFNNMLLQKNLGDAIADVAAPDAANLDIDLKGAVTTAIQNNRDITIAELQRKEAEADVSAAAAAKNPSLGYTWNTTQKKASIAPKACNYSGLYGLLVKWKEQLMLLDIRKM